jgi:transposase
MAETRRKLDQDFREGAVRLVRETGKPIAQVARDLGINSGTLGNWVNADRARHGGDGQLSEDERAELARLRKENAELAMRCDVLKRSVALGVQDAMERLMAAFRSSGEDPDSLGITGSAAFRAAYQMETDLDFLLYGGLTLARFASAVSGDFEAFSTLDPADERRSAYVRERPGLFPRPELAERRSDVGWCGPVKVDLTEVGPPQEPVADLIFDRPRSATGELTGVVESVARGYPVRCRLQGGAPVVVVTRRGWQGILPPGDQIRTSGVLYSSLSGDEFVVDEFGRDSVIAGQ